MTPELTDQQLLARVRARQGEERVALEELVRRHRAFVYATARRHARGGDPHLADDVTQAVFIVLVRKAGSIREGGFVMAKTKKERKLESLRRQIGRIGPDGDGLMDYRAIEEPVPAQVVPDGRTMVPAERGPFGRWLLQQEHTKGLVGQLAKCAKADPAFPRDGDPDAVRARLSAVMAEGDMFEAVDDAEMDWASY